MPEKTRWEVNAKMTDKTEQAIREITRMHAAIEAWVRGVTPKEDFEAEILGHLAPEFRIVEPNGQIVTRDQAMTGLFKFHGGNPDFRNTIDGAEILMASDDFILATYVESQTGAKLASNTNVRRATCLFSIVDRLQHLYLHETWIEGNYVNEAH